MLRFFSSISSYLSLLPSELQEELLLLLTPKEILPKVSDLEDFERVWNRETFWERVWRKWVSPRLPVFSEFPIREIISLMCKKAEEWTPEQLLLEGSRRGILFYGIEARERERGANISARDNEALRKAAKRGHSDIVSYLIEAGANPRTLN